MNSTRIATGLAAALLLCGCAAAALHMKLSPELESAAPHQVHARHDRNDTPHFGNWRVVIPPTFTVQSRSTGGEIVPARNDRQLALNRNRTTFDFAVESSASRAPVTWSAQCESHEKSAALTEFHGGGTDETSATLPGYPRIECRFSGPSEGRLIMGATLAQTDAGTAEFVGHHWDVRSVNLLEQQASKIPLARFGYEFRLNDRVVAAVETIDAGRVWMQPDLPVTQQDELSVVATALLYYVDVLALSDD